MLLELKNVSKSFKEHIIFENLDINFSSPGFYLLSGPSGSGKTTLFNMIAGYEPFEKGSREISDISLACIFQSYELIEELTVLENIRMSCDLKDEPFDEYLLMKLGIDEFKNHYPKELSGGQKQRVGIARALYQKPNIILCDEPTESLDIENKEIVLEMLKELSKKCVVLVACHELSVVQPYYDYHYVIENQQIVLKEQRKAFENVNIDLVSSKPNKKALKKYIQLIVRKRTIVSVLFFGFLVILQLLIYNWDIQIFAKQTSLDALNGHILYVTLLDEQAKGVKTMGIDCKPIVSFDSVVIENNNYKIGVYPLESEEYALEKNEVLINDKMLHLYSDETKETIINKPIHLSYKLDDEKYEVDFVIKGVVEEKDAYFPQVYYRYDCIPIPSEDEMINYEIITLTKNTEKLYLSLKEKRNVEVSNSVLDMRTQNEKFMILYRYLFQFVELVAFITTIISIYYFNKKDTQRDKTCLSIMFNAQVPLKMIKRCYFAKKSSYMFTCFLVLCGIAYVVKSHIPITTSIGYVCILMACYIITLIYQLFKFKIKDISNILKDNKD